MGEYARRKQDGESVKIGTCEDMHYLRAQDAGKVTREPGSVDPVAQRTALRFRFPFPWEDSIAPGNYESVARPFIVPGLDAPSDVAHHPTQFRASGGYLASLPCPESGAVVEGVTIHRNGWAGAFGIVAQKPQPDGSVWVVCQCTGCGAMWRADAESAERIAVAFRSEADRCAKYDPTDARIRTYHDMADRVMAGYPVAQRA